MTSNFNLFIHPYFESQVLNIAIHEVFFCDVDKIKNRAYEHIMKTSLNVLWTIVISNSQYGLTLPNIL